MNWEKWLIQNFEPYQKLMISLVIGYLSPSFNIKNSNCYEQFKFRLLSSLLKLRQAAIPWLYTYSVEDTVWTQTVLFPVSFLVFEYWQQCSEVFNTVYRDLYLPSRRYSLNTNRFIPSSLWGDDNICSEVFGTSHRSEDRFMHVYTRFY